MTPSGNAPPDSSLRPGRRDAHERLPPRPAALGMLAGIVIGSGLSTLLFVFTLEPLWFTLVGVGTAVGLVIGAAAESKRGSKPPQ